MPYARVFSALTAVGAAAMGSLMLAAPAFSLLRTTSCLDGQPRAAAYPFLSPGFNELLCKINTVMLGGRATPAGALLSRWFGGLLVTAVMLAVYESFRPSSRRSASKKAHGNAEGFGMRLGLAQLATPLIALGQFVTAGVALPAYYALTAWSTPKHWRQHTHKPDLGDEIFVPKEERDVPEPHKHSAQYNANIPRSSFLYTTVISTLLGLVIPSVVLRAAPANRAWDALSAWQAFPLYMLAINTVLPPSLRRTFSTVAPTRAIALIATLGIVVSLKTQYDVYRGLEGVGIRDMFLLSRPAVGQMADIDTAGHTLFLVDLALVYITTVSQVVLSVGIKTGASTAGKIVYAVGIALATPVVGPGAAIMGLWAYGELAALQRANEFKEIEGKKKHK